MDLWGLTANFKRPSPPDLAAPSSRPNERLTDAPGPIPQPTPIKEVEDEIKAARSIREENQRVSELAQITAERDEARVQVVLANAAASRKHLGGGAASGFLAGDLETIKQSEVAAKAEVAEALRREAAAVEAAAKWEATALEALAKADEAMAAVRRSSSNTASDGGHSQMGGRRERYGRRGEDARGARPRA